MSDTKLKLKPKPVVTHSHTFSHALDQLREITWSFDCFTGLSASLWLVSVITLVLVFYNTQLKITINLHIASLQAVTILLKQPEAKLNWLDGWKVLLCCCFWGATIYSKGFLGVIMSSSHALLLAVSEEAKIWLQFFFIQCIIKQ